MTEITVTTLQNQGVSSTTSTQTVAGNVALLTSNSSSQTVRVGSFVTDVSMQAYMSQDIIAFQAVNMRPNHLMHVFFDGVKVDAYCRPGRLSDTVDDPADYRIIEPTNTYGSPIYSDANGCVYGWFRIPGETFRVGDRTLQITDVDSLALGNTAFTCIASAEYTAFNLAVTKESPTITTINTRSANTQVAASIVSASRPDSIGSIISSNTTPEEDSEEARLILQTSVMSMFWDPIAQIIPIRTPKGQSGIYASSVELYFKQKPTDQTHGVMVFICETNNGFPDTTKILPYTQIHKNHSQIAVSTTAATSTKFSFTSLVFMENGKDYALVIRPDGSDPDYHLWMANIGDKDVSTNQQVFSQPIAGTAFYGASQSLWVPLPTEYVKFKLNRANFTAYALHAIYTPALIDYIKVENLEYANTSVGISPGNFIFKATNSSPATVNTSVQYQLQRYDSTNSFITAEAVTLTGYLSLTSDFIQIHDLSSNGSSPSANATPNSSTLVAWANTTGFMNMAYESFVPMLSYITPPGTSIDVMLAGTSNTYVREVNTAIRGVVPGTEKELLDRQRIIASRTNEIATGLGGSTTRSFMMHVLLKSDNSYVSPILDGMKYQNLVVHNEVDPVGFSYREFFTNSSTKAKYISQIVTLADGQDSEDLQIRLTAHRPPGSDIKVFARFLNAQDPEPMAKKTWTPLINKNPNLFSPPNAPESLNEFVYVVPSGIGAISTTGLATSVNTAANVSGYATEFDTQLEEGFYVSMSSSTQPMLNNTPYAITANTLGVDVGNNVILLTGASTKLPVNTRVWYSVPDGNTAISNLSTNTYYYVSAVNSTSFAVSATRGGANINIHTTATDDPGETHYFFFESNRTIAEKTRRVVDIISNTEIVLDEPFFGNYTNAAIYLVAPPTTAFSSPGSSSQIPGTVTTSTETNGIVGSGTNFIQNFAPGSIIKTANDSQVVTKITNSTYLEVGTPWSSNSSGGLAYRVMQPGLSYLSEDDSLYNTFKKFQIKVVIQSNDPSKVPLIDDLRCVALLL